jgi:hypothetical protein
MRGDGASAVRDDGPRRSIGLLPCEAVFRAAEDGTIVEALDARVIAAVAGEPELTEIAEDAAARQRAALDALSPD